MVTSTNTFRVIGKVQEVGFNEQRDLIISVKTRKCEEPFKINYVKPTLEQIRLVNNAEVIAIEGEMISSNNRIELRGWKITTVRCE